MLTRMNAVPVRRVTVAEFFALEEASETKHELINGEIVAMSGGTLRNAAIEANLVGILSNGFRGSKCRPYSSNARVHVLATDLDTYPDISIIRGKPEISPDDKHAATNPTVLVEILSRSTKNYDRGAKWAHYQRIASLQEYLLVSAGELRIERYRRIEGNVWRYDVAEGESAMLKLDSCPATIELAEVYRELPED
ncbi:MAG: Uma2 family endonuclease [Polyangiales bacterium]